MTEKIRFFLHIYKDFFDMIHTYGYKNGGNSDLHGVSLDNGRRTFFIKNSYFFECSKNEFLR